MVSVCYLIFTGLWISYFLLYFIVVGNRLNGACLLNVLRYNSWPQGGLLWEIFHVHLRRIYTMLLGRLLYSLPSDTAILWYCSSLCFYFLYGCSIHFWEWVAELCNYYYTRGYFLYNYISFALHIFKVRYINAYNCYTFFLFLNLSTYTFFLASYKLLKLNVYFVYQLTLVSWLLFAWIIFFHSFCLNLLVFWDLK